MVVVARSEVLFVLATARCTAMLGSLTRKGIEKKARTARDTGIARQAARSTRGVFLCFGFQSVVECGCRMRVERTSKAPLTATAAAWHTPREDED